MDTFFGQIQTIVLSLLGVSAVILVTIVISYLLDKLLSKDLSDQDGWRNYRGPIIGTLLLIIAILVLILVVLLLLNIN